MKQRYCQAVIGDTNMVLAPGYPFDTASEAFAITVPENVCGKPARFQLNVLVWLCAEHWDEWEKTRA